MDVAFAKPSRAAPGSLPAPSTSNSSPAASSCLRPGRATYAMLVSFLSKDLRNYPMAPHNIGAMSWMPGDELLKLVKSTFETFKSRAWSEKFCQRTKEGKLSGKKSCLQEEIFQWR